ncbi:MAG: glycosyltransferase family 39 protein [Proteobacteria bacterium]|nr:glycosyltransferase family 39 protein [Pseudomonadota bacterium]
MRDSRPGTGLLRALPWWLLLWLLAAALAIFANGPMPMYSTRTLGVAWEMWSRHEFWVPYINGAPYSQKVPLLFWLIHAGWFVFGVNDVWPRILELLIGAAQLVLAWILARRLFPQRPWVARATPWMLAALSFAFLFGLQIMYEVLLSVWVLGALLCLAPAPQRASPRWIGLAICLGLGLLTKGPVMALHVVFVWLLGPWWNGYARRERLRWYGLGLLAFAGGFAMLAAWVIPAIHIGGAAYANELLFKQTAGRVVEAFDHARPLWWYLPWLPAVLFPFVAWPRAWVAVASLRPPLENGLRFCIAWMAPVFVVFCLLSGKQTYYLIPELPAAMLLLACALARLRERGVARGFVFGPWPLAIGAFALAALLLSLPWLVASGRIDDPWLHDLSVRSAPFGVLYLLMGAWMLRRGGAQLRRIAAASLIGASAAYVLFALTLSPGFDLAPVSRLLARAQAQHRAVGNLDIYEGQFHFFGRLTQPIDRLYEGGVLQQWAHAHPDGLIVEYPSNLDPADLRYAVFVQPFRSVWLVVWDAPTLAALRRGETPPVPSHPPMLYPAGYWRYAKIAH